MGANNAAVSPFAPKKSIQLPPIEGVVFSTGQAGIKYQNRTDVVMMMFAENTQVAGVFTRSKCPSAAVDWCRLNITHGHARALVVNSGNANAFTGQKGRDSVEKVAEIAATAACCKPSEVFIASTGVIGEPLNPQKFEGVLADCVKNAANSDWINAARAIMTTDTFPKVATATLKIDGVTITLNGIAKGAGMIAPDMATMLSFVFTDAPISAPVLQALLSKSVQTSFNAITVDGDTSTSDTLMLFATGAATAHGMLPIADLNDKRLSGFKRALNKILLNLAQKVAQDGEGARKFIRVDVTGAASARAAKNIARSIAHSPLVKTAFAGEDANWGRIVMAVGKAGEKAERDLLSIWFGDHRVAFMGERDPTYDEAAVSDYMKGAKLSVRADIGIGRGKFTMWTCDLTKEYVEVNGDYRS